MCNQSTPPSFVAIKPSTLVAINTEHFMVVFLKVGFYTVILNAIIKLLAYIVCVVECRLVFW